MADTPILLREQQYHQIKAVLARLRMDSAAKVVFLVDKDGQEIASLGEVGNLDTTSLASLTAGNVAATGGMAQLIGEKEFPTLSHEGEKESIHISVIGRLLLVVMFDERSSLGLVKLRSKQVSQQLATMFDEIASNDYDDLDYEFVGQNLREVAPMIDLAGNEIAHFAFRVKGLSDRSKLSVHYCRKSARGRRSAARTAGIRCQAAGLPRCFR